MSGQTIYTIHESQLNNGSGGGGNSSSSGRRNSGQQQQPSTDLLIDTSSIPLTQQTMPPMHHQHLQQQQQLQPTQTQFGDQQQTTNETITSQPSVGSARVAPEGQSIVYSVHPVFNMLDQHEALLIRQRADPTSTCCGFESVNSYTVRSRDGSPVLQAIENSNCCERCCFEGNREYNLSLVLGDEVIARISKAYRVSRFCCYSNAVRIESPEENPVGHIRQLFTLFGHPRYAIYDCQQQPKTPTFLVEPSSCRFCCTPFLCTCLCSPKQFRIVTGESPREQVGTIARHWELAANASRQPESDDQSELAGANCSPEAQADGEAQEAHSAGQLFGVQFAPQLEARHKLLLLSACFMMDFFYFENDRRRRKLASC